MSDADAQQHTPTPVSPDLDSLPTTTTEPQHHNFLQTEPLTLTLGPFPTDTDITPTDVHDIPLPDPTDPNDPLNAVLPSVTTDEPKDEPMAVLDTVDPSATHDTSQEALPEHDPELKRVKVYELIGSRWVDQGTAYCHGQFIEETNQAFLIARAEEEYERTILSTAIRCNDVYQRQQDTLIVWTEPDGVDYALSFQDAEGCAEVWNFIIEVQHHINSSEAGGFDSSSPNHDSTMTATILRTGHLPMPELGNVADIERSIKALARGQHVKEKICDYIQRQDYIKAMINVLNVAEDLESLDNLHALCSLMQTILMLNDHGMYEHILDDDKFFGVVGMLEYDPEFPTHKANYREFLHLTSRFHQPIPIPDESIQKKVHNTYRLQFLKDVVLARALDDSTFNVLNSCIIFNQIDIITHVQNDPMFMREIVSLYVSAEILGSGHGNGSAKPASKGAGAGAGAASPSSSPEVQVKKEAEAEGASGAEKANGSAMTNGNGVAHAGPSSPPDTPFTFGPPANMSAEDVALRREVVVLIQQLCAMGKNVQLPARMALFRTLVDCGVLFAVQWALGLSERGEPSSSTPRASSSASKSAIKSEDTDIDADKAAAAAEAKASVNMAEANLVMISTAGEVLSAVLEHDLVGVRNHVLKQVQAVEKEKQAGRKGADKAETLLALMCRVLAGSRELAVQSQVGDALRTLLEISVGNGPETPAAMGAKLLARPKDDPATEKFMDYFYKNCIETLFRPFGDVPEFKKLTEPVLLLSREKTNLYLYLCDLLCGFAQQHAFRSHFYILSSNISLRIASLLTAKDKHLRVAAFRFFRVCIKINNRNLLAHLMKLDVFRPILELTVAESRRDSLLSASCQEFFEHMRRENMKEVIAFCMDRHGEMLRRLAETPLGGPRFMMFVRRHEMNVEPPPPPSAQEGGDKGGVGEDRNAREREARRVGRGMDAEEEDYFNGDDEDDDGDDGGHVSYISLPARGRLTASPGSPGAGIGGVGVGAKRKRRDALSGSGSGSGNRSKGPGPGVFRPQSVQIPKPPPLGALVDYGEDEDDVAIGPPTPPPDTEGEASSSADEGEGGPRTAADPGAGAEARTESLGLKSGGGVPPSPRLAHAGLPQRPRQLKREGGEEDGMEKMVTSPPTQPIDISKLATAKAGAGAGGVQELGSPPKLSEKRRREEDEEDEMERLVSRAKKVPSGHDSGAPKSKRHGESPSSTPPPPPPPPTPVAAATVTEGGKGAGGGGEGGKGRAKSQAGVMKTGDDPPVKKIKLALRSALGGGRPSTPGAKDGDTG